MNASRGLLSRLKGDVSKDVSKREPDQIRQSLDGFVCWDLVKSVMIEWVGLTSMVFLDIMKEDTELSRRACSFMIRSILTD